VTAASGKISDNRFDIARMIACGPEEPRFIGEQDLFSLQEAVIADILRGEKTAEARSVVALANDPIQQSLAEDLKAAMRRQLVTESPTI
jgi:hypothetical protein